MGRRFIGFLIGVLICALVFAVVAIQSRAPHRGADVPPNAAVSADRAAAVPETAEAVAPTGPAPEAAVALADPVQPTPAEPAEQAAEEPPVVIVDATQPPGPALAEAPRPEVDDPAEDAPLKKPEGLTEVAPAPKPVPPVPNPPFKIAGTDPVRTPTPEPGAAPEMPAKAPADVAPKPQATVTPEPEPAAEAATEPEAAPEQVAVAQPAPAVEPASEEEPKPETAREDEPQQPATPVLRRARLPVVSDDTSRSAGIGIGRPIDSDLPSVTSPDTAPLTQPTDPSLPTAPASTGAKRLVVQKSDTSGRDKVAILTVQPEEPQPVPEAPRAIDRYGVLFDAGDRPLMSIILVDVGNDGVPLNAAATLDLPVTFAIAVDRGDAALAARTYFENDHEVLALSPRSVELSLSGGQTGQQIVDLLTEFFSIVPQSVGLLDVPEATLQNDRVLSNHVLAALHETGHALVTYEQGLNAVRREAEKAGVPTGLIYRALDQKGESIDAIERHLDRAANEASRSGHVLVIGSTRADTIEAIRNWTQSRAARTVTLAPVSASLKQN